MSGDVTVTEELAAEFDRVFGSNEPEASSPTSDGSKEPTAVDRQRAEEEAEELEGLEGASGEDLKGEQFGKDEPKAGDEKKPVGSQEPGKAKDDSGAEPESTLPAYLRHAAKRAGWDDDDIKGLYEQNPDLAIRSFSKLHDSFSDMASRYGQIGQMSAMQQGQPVASPQHPVPQAPPPTQADPLQAFLQQRYGDKLGTFNERFGEGFVDDILKPLAEPVSRMESEYQSQHQAAVGQEVQAFFKQMPTDYDDLYGKGAQVTDEQSLARQEVFQLADWIRAGAQQSSGVQLSVGDALDYAVTKHSAPHMALIERQRLTASIKKRSSKITSRPTQRKSAPEAADQPKGIESAMAAYTQRAGELGFGVDDPG